MVEEELAISDATAADAGEILVLQRLAYETEARRYDDWDIAPMTEPLAGVIAAIMDETVLKATRGGAIVGSVRATAAAGICRIGRLMVHPDCQGRGIGARLLQAIEERFPAVSSFELFTGSRSEGNIRLYTRAGYTVVGARRISDRVTLVDMCKRVPG